MPLTWYFFAPPAGFEPATHGLGNRQSEPVFDLLRAIGNSARDSVIPQPSQNCRSLAVNDGEMAGGDV